MRFITAAAISRRTVTLLAVIILLAGGVFAYNSLQVELFPEIEFPLVVVTTSYPSADPEGVVKDVTAPIERVIEGTEGLESIQSTSFEGNSIVLATFQYGTDMADAESAVQNHISVLTFPDGVDEPEVGRFDPDQFPVLQFSVITDDGTQIASEFVESRILPELSGIDGILQVLVTGEVEQQVRVSADPDRMLANDVALPQIAAALGENNVTLPAGLVFREGGSMPVKTIHILGSVEEVRNLAVSSTPSGVVMLRDVADVELTEGTPASISRTNGKPAINVSIVKEAEANTIEVTEAVREALEALGQLPPGLEIVIVSDQGPEIQQQIDTLLSEALYGFLFAVAVVFIFMLSIRPTVVRGLLTTLRPTIVIALSIPLSIFSGILLMTWQDMTLNFMTLGGLAISVGRVVDDAIVVLENVYRHIQAGRERWRAALDATTEVGPAIFASTLTTIVVFIPLGFIQGLVGAFFLPFALTVVFALAASLVVALTAVPVLGAYLLRPGDLPEGAGEDDVAFVHETWMQRAYAPVIRWALGHKAVTIIAAVVLTVASLALLSLIPVTLFPGGGQRYIEVNLTLPPGTPPDRTLAEVIQVESEVRDIAEIYTATVGATDLGGGGVPGSFNQASLLVALTPDAPENAAGVLRERLQKPGRQLQITELADGPPTSGVEISIAGPNYQDIAQVSDELVSSLSSMDGVVNLTSDVTQARQEVAVEVDPSAAAEIGLTSRQVGFQLSQFLVGRAVTSITIDGKATEVVLSGSREAASSIDKVGDLIIAGPGGTAPLRELARIATREGPVTISRTDRQRSASITGDITAEDTQAIGVEIDGKIAELDLPPGVSVTSGGIFADIAEGFQAIFLSMAVGIILMYLVMVASLGSLRNPFIIITSLPLALIGVMVALAITGRTLGLPAMMGLLLLIGIVVTNAIVLIAFVEQLRSRGMSVTEALVTGGLVRLRPILMTALTTSFALLPLASFSGSEGGIISSELATVVIGGLISSTALTLIVVPVVYYLFNVSIPGLFSRLRSARTAISTA
ncbi:MAG: efflux RND transporter permease subunit [Chloroflexi bacterium]|nr:efflux RND transporter permease subunit [Chloroflexota bacterium]MYE39323.1 efflux RND transporter permease subunit [Chloroflexota bacterium]